MNKPESKERSTIGMFILLVVGCVFLVLGLLNVAGAVMDMFNGFAMHQLFILGFGAFMVIVGCIIIFRDHNVMKG